MSVDRTNLKFRLFDRQRKRFGTDNDLELITFIPTTGYATFDAISKGWFGKKVTSAALGAEFFEVRIAENGTDLSPTFRERITHLKIGSYYYKVSGVDNPKQIPKVWVIRCNPTGERSAS